MSKINNVEIIYEFTNNDMNTTCGVYKVMFDRKEKVFIRNDDSVGVVAHYLGKPASKCVSIICDNVRDEFLEFLEKENNT